MHFANPGLLGGVSDFQERYASPIANGNPEAAARLRAKIRPFVLRRTKREVLPGAAAADRHGPPRRARRGGAQRLRRRPRRDQARASPRSSRSGGGVLAALEALLRLRQAACHSALVPGQHAETSSKIERLLEALEDAVAEGHKALVFSQWTSLLDLRRASPRHGRASASRASTARRAIAARSSREFQDEAGPPVMLVSLKAGGTGLNLTAADHVFLLDPWWNPAVEEQAADRAHRIGQERPVMVYRMVAKDTVEERILALQEKQAPHRRRRAGRRRPGGRNHAGGAAGAARLKMLRPAAASPDCKSGPGPTPEGCPSRQGLSRDGPVATQRVAWGGEHARGNSLRQRHGDGVPPRHPRAVSRSIPQGRRVEGGHRPRRGLRDGDERLAEAAFVAGGLRDGLHDEGNAALSGARWARDVLCAGECGLRGVRLRSRQTGSVRPPADHSDRSR